MGVGMIVFYIFIGFIIGADVFMAIFLKYVNNRRILDDSDNRLLDVLEEYTTDILVDLEIDILCDSYFSEDISKCKYLLWGLGRLRKGGDESIPSHDELEKN